MKFATAFLTGLLAFAATAEAKWVKVGPGPSLAAAEARCQPQGLNNTEAFIYGGFVGLAYNSVKNSNRKRDCMARLGWQQQRGGKAKKPASRKTNFTSG